jgi:hypothetical protein
VDPWITLLEMWRVIRANPRMVRLVLAGAALAGLLVAFQPGFPPESRQYRVWFASADILVDTSDSEVFDAKRPNFLTLASRASLLGNLVETDPLRNAIAKSAGVPPDRLLVKPPSGPTSTPTGTVDPSASADGSSTPGSSSIPDAEATLLTLTTDSTLPILTVTAQAPSADVAEGLAAATGQELERHLDSVAAREQIPEARKLVVHPLAAPIAVSETRGPHWLLGVVTALLVALAGLAAIGAAPMLAQRWRQAEEQASLDEPEEPSVSLLVTPASVRNPPRGTRESANPHQ